MKGILGGLRQRETRRDPKPGRLIRLAPASAATKPSSGPVLSLPVPRPATPENLPAESGPSPVDNPKMSSTGDRVAVLTLGESGEILSARGDCLVVFGLECAALPRQNIGAFLDGGLDNDVGRFLERRRRGENITETILLRVMVLSRHGARFPASVTSPTWTSNPKLTQGSASSPFGWTVAFRASALAEAHDNPVPTDAVAAPAGLAESVPLPSNASPAPLKPELPVESQELNDRLSPPQPSPGASSMGPANELTSLRQLRIQLEGQLAAEQQAGADARRQAE
ncbi:MAG TPA: hypothetical protein VEO53_18815, partial [Candidatus Binatia bacterium]|nr:hypothetical protein [Candidatus Binatia bacterium]